MKENEDDIKVANPLPSYLTFLSAFVRKSEKEEKKKNSDLAHGDHFLAQVILVTAD